jgi:hypothetical protein
MDDCHLSYIATNKINKIVKCIPKYILKWGKKHLEKFPSVFGGTLFRWVSLFPKRRDLTPTNVEWEGASDLAALRSDSIGNYFRNVAKVCVFSRDQSSNVRAVSNQPSLSVNERSWALLLCLHFNLRFHQISILYQESIRLDLLLQRQGSNKYSACDVHFLTKCTSSSRCHYLAPGFNTWVALIVNSDYTRYTHQMLTRHCTLQMTQLFHKVLNADVPPISQMF